MKTRNLNYLKAGFSLVLLVYGTIMARDVTESRFLDRVDLIAHEAGHLFFHWFGEFIMVMGGTIGQLLAPVCLVVYFSMRRELFSSAVTLFWVGQNFFNISVYVKDAQAMELPLVSLGGDPIHDWNYILSKLGLLRYDHVVGNAVFGVGILIIVFSVIMGFYLSFSKSDEVNNGKNASFSR